MTPSIPVPSHPSLTFNRRSFMILGGVGICGALAACGGAVQYCPSSPRARHGIVMTPRIGK